eukprot:2760002-Prorocentrum_lima.AAC.1
MVGAFRKPGKCKVTGTLPRDGVTVEEEVPTLVFLGMVVEVLEEKLAMHRRPYLENRLKKRCLLSPNFGKESLPEPREGHYLQEDKDTP